MINYCYYIASRCIMINNCYNLATTCIMINYCYDIAAICIMESFNDNCCYCSNTCFNYKLLLLQ